MTNMPISRFLTMLQQSGKQEAYMEKLEAAYNPQAAASVMCRDMVLVGWDGTLYDCDFNQMLDMTAGYGPSNSYPKLRRRHACGQAHRHRHALLWVHGGAGFQLRRRGAGYFARRDRIACIRTGSTPALTRVARSDTS